MNVKWYIIIINLFLIKNCKEYCMKCNNFIILKERLLLILKSFDIKEEIKYVIEIYVFD